MFSYTSIKLKPKTKIFLQMLRRVLSANDNTQLRELRHPNILQFLGSIMHDGQMILITEHLPKVSICIYVVYISRIFILFIIKVRKFIDLYLFPIHLLSQGSLYDILSKRVGLDLPLALRFALDIARYCAITKFLIF